MTTLPLAAPAPARLFSPLPMGIAALWFAAVLATQLSTPGPSPLPVPLLIGGPVVLFLAALLALPGLRAWVGQLDLAVLVGVQTWRVAGITFLFVWAFGLLPGSFAWPAGVGDTAVGLAALGVTLMVARQAAGWRRAALWLTLAGMADFALAFATAQLSQPGRPLDLPGAPPPAALQDLPMILIPGFLVPLFLILHIMALVRLRSPD